MFGMKKVKKTHCEFFFLLFFIKYDFCLVLKVNFAARILMKNFPKSGVFKIPVEEDFVYYYAQSSLVSHNNELYCPEKFENIDSVAFMCKVTKMIYCENKTPDLVFMRFCGHERCKKVRVMIIRNIAGGVAYFRQHHLIDRYVIEPPNVNDNMYYDIFYQGTLSIEERRRFVSHHIWSRFILNQDHITIRIIRIQRFLRSMTLLKRQRRLHLLAIFTFGNNELNMDVTDLIGSML